MSICISFFNLTVHRFCSVFCEFELCNLQSFLVYKARKTFRHKVQTCQSWEICCWICWCVFFSIMCKVRVDWLLWVRLECPWHAEYVSFFFYIYGPSFCIWLQLLQVAASNHLHISLMIWRKKFNKIQQDTFLHKLSCAVESESILNNPMHSVTIQYNASVSLNSRLYRNMQGTCHWCIRHCHLNAIHLSNLHLEELPNMQYFCNTSANYCAK